MHGHHSLTRAEQARRIIEQVNKEFNPPSEEQSAEEREAARRLWWSSYFKGLAVMFVVFIVIAGAMLAMASKHGGHGLGETATFNSYRR